MSGHNLMCRCQKMNNCKKGPLGQVSCEMVYLCIYSWVQLRQSFSKNVEVMQVLNKYWTQTGLGLNGLCT